MKKIKLSVEKDLALYDILLELSIQAQIISIKSGDSNSEIKYSNQLRNRLVGEKYNQLCDLLNITN